MAREMELPGSELRFRIRNPWAVALLPIFTLGVYGVVWWYRINVEMKEYGEVQGYEIGRNPKNSLFALIPGCLLLFIPPAISYWRGTKRVQGTAAVADIEPLNGFIALLLFFILPPAMPAFLQVSLNKVWEKELRDAS
jgi:hypothetical protein